MGAMKDLTIIVVHGISKELFEFRLFRLRWSIMKLASDEKRLWSREFGDSGKLAMKIYREVNVIICHEESLPWQAGRAGWPLHASWYASVR